MIHICHCDGVLMQSKSKAVLVSDLYILLAAAVWGGAFVAQRASVGHIGTFFFNGIRFGIGAVSLIPLWVLTRKKGTYLPGRKTILPSLLVGLILFAGVTMQQVSLSYTTAGNAGFITGLYVVFIPLAGIFFRKRIHFSVFIAGLLALAGLFMLSFGNTLTVNKGDMIVFFSTFFWTAHVLYIGHLSGRHDPLIISIVQFLFCSFISIAAGTLFEPFALKMVSDSLIPLLYGGLISVGIGYTLQVVGQKYSPPHHAAILMSMESVFAVITASLFLGEELSIKMILGCSLMFSGMVVAQIGKVQGDQLRTSSVVP